MTSYTELAVEIEKANTFDELNKVWAKLGGVDEADKTKFIVHFQTRMRTLTHRTVPTYMIQQETPKQLEIKGIGEMIQALTLIADKSLVLNASQNKTLMGAKAGGFTEEEIKKYNAMDLLHKDNAELLKKFTDVTLIGAKEERTKLDAGVRGPLLKSDYYTDKTKPKGILMFGPPGTGKTYLAGEALKQVIVLRDSGTIGKTVQFYNVRLSDLSSANFGEAEQNISRFFKYVIEGAENKPDTRFSIVFMDEVDTISGDRKKSGETMRRITNQFLQELDGIGTRQNFFIIAATNLVWTIDSGVARRLGEKIYVGLPNKVTRFEVFKSAFVKLKSKDKMKQYFDVFDNWRTDKKNIAQFERSTALFSIADVDLLARNVISRPVGLAIQFGVDSDGNRITGGEVNQENINKALKPETVITMIPSDITWGLLHTQSNTDRNEWLMSIYYDIYKRMDEINIKEIDTKKQSDSDGWFTELILNEYYKMDAQYNYQIEDEIEWLRTKPKEFITLYRKLKNDTFTPENERTLSKWRVVLNTDSKLDLKERKLDS